MPSPKAKMAAFIAKEQQAHIRRQRGLNDIAASIEVIYGARCDRNEPGCMRCAAWAIFDCLERLTDRHS